jgi:hypothetical protein
MRVQSMRTQTHRLKGAADSARLDKLACADRGAILKALAVADRVDSTSLGLKGAHLRQLVERGEARLVDEIVLIVAQHADTQRGTLVGDACAGDELDARVLENIVSGPASRAWG